MPLFLLPPPQRIRITRRNFSAPAQPTLWVDPLVAGAAGAAVARLEAVISDLQETLKVDVPAQVRLSLLDGERATGRVDEPASGRADEHKVRSESERLILEVAEEGISLSASGAAGLLYGSDLVEQLASDEGFVGVRIEDWPAFPTRELSLPLSPDALAPECWARFLDNLSRYRFNRLALAPAVGEGTALTAAQTLGVALGIEIVTGEETRPDVPRLLDPGDGGVIRAERLVELHTAALAAVAAGRETWHVAVGALEEDGFLDTLWHGIAWAGMCGWNPQKAELRALRRSFGARFFGPTAGPAFEALEAIQAGVAAAEDGRVGGARSTATGEGRRAGEVNVGDESPGTEAASPVMPVLTALFWEDPFAPHGFRRWLRGGERAREVSAQAQRALDALEEAGGGVERNADAMALLEWPARRLALQTEHLLTMERIREHYADAYLATGNPRSVSQRLLGAAEMLRALANRTEEMAALFEGLWPRERSGAPPTGVLAPYAARATLLREKAQALRAARDTYIQTGNLVWPEAVGLERAANPGSRGGAGLGRHLTAGRLPPPHSPPWWPDGGAARVRIETRSDSTGLPWEVLIDFRALAGQEGAFHLGQARLVSFDDVTDAVGPDVPCQLTRGGIVLVPEAGKRTYYLYLEPRGAVETGRRDENAERKRSLRVRQTADGITVENAGLMIRIERAQGTLDRWRLASATSGEAEEMVAPRGADATGLCSLPEAPPAEAPRLRVVEHGPLLVRVQAEQQDGRIRQDHFYSGFPGCEFAINAPVTRIRNPLRGQAWPPGETRFLASGETDPSDPSDPGAAAPPALWAARTRPDGLAFAVLCPDGPARHWLTPEEHDVRGEPGLAHTALCSERTTVAVAEAEPLVQRLTARLDALRRPPVVQLGPVEERRTREF